MASSGISSAGVVVTTLLVEQTGLNEADPIWAGVVAAMILARAMPAISASAATLLNRVPARMGSGRLRGVLDRIRRLDSVIGIRDVHVVRFSVSLSHRLPLIQQRGVAAVFEVVNVSAQPCSHLTWCLLSAMICSGNIRLKRRSGL